jgi:hypothetical protein
MRARSDSLILATASNKESVQTRMEISLAELAQLDEQSLIEKAQDERVFVKLPEDYVHNSSTREGQCLEKYALTILKDKEMARTWINWLISATAEQQQQKLPASTRAPREIPLAELTRHPSQIWEEAARSNLLTLALPENFDLEPGSREWACYQTYTTTLLMHVKGINPPKREASTSFDLITLSDMIPEAWELATGPRFKVEIPQDLPLNDYTDQGRQIHACLSKYIETLEKQLKHAEEINPSKQGAPTSIDLITLSGMIPEAWEYTATSPHFKVEIPKNLPLNGNTDQGRQIHACLSKYIETLKEKQLSPMGRMMYTDVQN